MAYDVILIDAKNATFRHGFTRALLSNSEGTPTGAIFGLLGCLIRLYGFYPKAKFIFCWDGDQTHKSWRNKFCKTYKANRRKPNEERPPEVTAILKQIPIIRKMLSILGFRQFVVPTLEADDLIGILANELSKKKDIARVLIYSMDKDMYQLIGDKISVVRDLDKSLDCKALTKKDILKDFGVSPKNWNRYRALIGDPSDGIASPFPKIGKVRALKLLAEGLNPEHKVPQNKIEKLYAEHWPKAHENYRLSKIVTKADSKVLSETEKLNIGIILRQVDKGCGRKNKDIFDTDGVKRFVKFCVKYELNYILEQRHILYRIGW